MFLRSNLAECGIGNAQLTQARDNGVRRAILFAASKAAEAAYAAIGFRRIGTYRVVMFNTPRTIVG
ncbi:hypothetical protein [uncultured Tateyamaria sp.]|uniref:hypothetical protein n=1 Tax=uncultured Tateyamaria sp. TaxID=455651 RepID=UPI0026057B2A|nr:hypothetical protein [uncultured Tateyamaria sp.]